MTGPEALAQLHAHKYINLATFRRTGQEVLTPVWFAEQDGKLYVMTRTDSGKYKRIRNNPRVRIASCTARGKITGPWSDGRVRVLAPDEDGVARQGLARKYFLMRFPWLWSKKNIFLEVTLGE